MLDDNTYENDNTVTYDRNLLFASPLQLKRKKLPKLHFNDLTSGNLYSYYNVINGELF